MAAAYSDRTLVTRIGPLHADQARPEDHPAGLPTSSSTMPGLVVRMYQFAQLSDGADVLDVGTGSGYGCALLAQRLGEKHVTSIDIDPYLTESAGTRLDQAGLHPAITICDADGPLPGSYDRIVSMVSVKPVPASWLAALRPGGRLVTVLAGTTLLVTATKTADGGARGQVEWDRAGFMATRTGPDYSYELDEFLATIERTDGDQITRGRNPVLELEECWELRSMLEVTAPGIAHRYRVDSDGTRTAWMAHADGSWARASADGTQPPLVHQAGPRRLWDILDELRDYWLSHGRFPLYGAQVTIPPDGSVIHLQRGRWQATIT
jgi:protein-L-isoaspartate O-methyltransferase